ncbi:hypothetical protein SAMN05443572_10913 [Myxococcus fulvus]|uniref:Uncharacterized protein n=1 Tax=Myxococcus fulvus TaxID=33 RepID=A0A511T770_MYXFU|nr:hypothetical protein [Myxococcus fulvus]GEN09362.1 hypothetical protein MFU01_43990 [Myxococcus fulvus]SEU31748.1 hypothetical protein SAMN05443572_10913 [Myxococcus fulvus]
MSSTLESYELIRFAEAFEARLATAGEMLAGRPGLDAEKSWLATALELVRTTRAPAAGVVDRVKDLPELDEAREEFAFHQQGLWVDALEKLHAGITFTASSRAPVIEALFPHLKFAQLRRAPRDTIFEYATSYDRRTRSAYVTRIFARDDFALVRPVMEQVATAHAAWRSSHEPAPLSPEQEEVLREELVSLGRKLEVALRQARLLSEAALVPVPSVHEAAALGLKPKRRAGRGLAPSDEGLGALDLEPADSMEPTEAELAEVAALDSPSEEGDATASAPLEASEVEPPALDEPTEAREGDSAGLATSNDVDSATVDDDVADATSSPDVDSAERVSGRDAAAVDTAPASTGARATAEEPRMKAGRGPRRASGATEAGADSARAASTTGARRGPVDAAADALPAASTQDARNGASPPSGSDADAAAASSGSAEASSLSHDGATSSEGPRGSTGRGRKREGGTNLATNDGAGSDDAGTSTPRGRRGTGASPGGPSGSGEDTSGAPRGRKRETSDDTEAPQEHRTRGARDTEGARAQAPSVRKKRNAPSPSGGAGSETP